MITAKEAKQKADAIIKAKADAELTMVNKEIKRRSDMGDFSTYFEGNLMEITREKLIELGYKLNTGGRMNEVETTVSWS